jgi:hypothetical protein
LKNCWSFKIAAKNLIAHVSHSRRLVNQGWPNSKERRKSALTTKQSGRHSTDQSARDLHWSDVVFALDLLCRKDRKSAFGRLALNGIVDDLKLY